MAVVAEGDAGLDRVAAVLAGGGVAAIPTDTVYGLAALPAGTDGLFERKGRPASVAVAVLVADLGQAEAVGALSEAARALAARWWPGGLTLVVDRRPGPTWDLGGDPTSLGLRVPDHPVPRELARRLGPLATTSANRHRRPTPPTAAGVAAELGADLLVLDGGRCEGAPSTVLDCRRPEPTVLREGRIPSADLL